MTNHSDLEEKLKAAREQFGDMLLNWRKRYGWSGRTWEDWAKACPDVLPITIVNSVITGLELKRNARTVPSTFVALGIANEALAKPERGVIADRVLHDRVYGAEPIRREDGTPWNGSDFFSAYSGFIEIPADLLAAEPEVTATVEELRQRFQQQRGNMTPRAALDTMLSFQPRISRQERDRIEEVMFGMASFDEGEALLARTVDRLLMQWAKNT